MAYDRGQIGKSITQIEQKLATDGQDAPAGVVIDAVVAAGICGRGVAQQVLSELRAGRKAKEFEKSAAEENEPPSREIAGLLTHVDDLHLEVDKKRRDLASAAAALIEDMKAAFSVIVTDQGLALQRSEENSRIQIELLEGSLAKAMQAEAEASEKLEAAEADRAELFARMTEAEEHRDALLAGLAAAEMERDQHRAAAEQLRLDLEANRHDLAMSRQTETALRDEMRASAAGQIDRMELMAKHEALAAALAQEQSRNADLHAQILRLVGTVLRPDANAEAAKPPDADQPSQ
ncbi:coiled-coil domain-containing protein [Devosia faecipullorum]|uniref:hypothetical protein n=1 Tax=Devosia faecipullorum TaxID=2755039 RepID=UPI00187BA3A5|nr:hypothetical protein [Devosia faecipullorum]MBE7734633.1 hypothetical protein [Devosia faecipullorum]